MLNIKMYANYRGFTLVRARDASPNITKKRFFFHSFCMRHLYFIYSNFRTPPSSFPPLFGAALGQYKFIDVDPN